MIFEQIRVGNSKNFSYLIGERDSGEAGVIDPGFDPEKIIAIAKKRRLQITKIFLTHFHYDHSGSSEVLAKMTGSEIFASKKGEEKRGKKEENGMWVIPEKFTAISKNSDIFIGKIKGKIWECPGHQNDHLCFLFEKYFFTGDTLFIGGIGRTDLPDSDPEKMKETLERIKRFPDDFLICPGHDYGEVPIRRLGEEKEKNPFL